eukprot:38105-Chlamydomonas_euryale.AAC.1
MHPATPVQQGTCDSTALLHCGATHIHSGGRRAPPLPHTLLLLPAAMLPPWHLCGQVAHIGATTVRPFCV